MQAVNGYDTVYKPFDSLSTNNIFVTGYVIMPNHVHALLYFPQMPKSLNMVIGNVKRFLAYETIKRLKEKKSTHLLEILHAGVKKSESKKGQIHKVSEDRFDAKDCRSREFIFQKLAYMHHNPINKKWKLVNDFADYDHSSASFYEKGIKKYEKLVNINYALEHLIPGSHLSQSQAMKTPG